MKIIASRLLAAVALLLAATYATAGDSYPARPIRLIVPSGAGGVTDILARVIAQQLSERLGQQVIVDNRPGASGIVGSQIVTNAVQDGYTLLMVRGRTAGLRGAGMERNPGAGGYSQTDQIRNRFLCDAHLHTSLTGHATPLAIVCSHRAHVRRAKTRRE